MIINSKLSDEALLNAIYRATSEYSNLIGNSYLIIGKNKRSNYFYFQCFFEKKHFMHLLGIECVNMNATEFYTKCDMYNKGKGDGISIADCTPSRNHSRTTINEKSSCCAEILRIQDAKYMKIGLKNKISQYVDFTYGYGSVATLGFKAYKETSFPLTLIPRNIDEFVSQKYKIVFVLEKRTGQNKFQKVLMELKKGLFEEVFEELPVEIKDMIDYKKK